MRFMIMKKAKDEAALSAKDEAMPLDHKAVTCSSSDSPVTVAATHAELVPEIKLPKPRRQQLRVPWGLPWVARSATLLVLALACCNTTSMLEGFDWVQRIPWGVFCAGFVAQLVDGSMGMGYGLTSSTILVAAGLQATTASSVVHLAQLGTTAVSGLAHYRAGNVDLPTVRRLSPFGAGAAFAGAALLTSLGEARVLQSLLLFGVGAYVLVRDSGSAAIEGSGDATGPSRSPTRLLLAPLGVVGGFIDATGGGGWGPVATSGLLADGRLTPARVIGTVSLAEFFVTVGCVVGFAAVELVRLASLLDLASSASAPPPTAAASEVASLASTITQMRLDLVATLLIGGLLAAPVAPAIVQWLPERVLGKVVGGFICLTNARGLLRAAGATGNASIVAYGTILLTTWSLTLRSVV